MKEFTLQTELWLPRLRGQVFPFFAEVRNLETITPPWLRFEVLTSGPIVMQRGALIDYRIRVHGITMRWRTEIAEWDPPRQFVDVQLQGPYTLWHHLHSFEEQDGGTLCRDHVRYRPRGGTFIHWLFVRRDVEWIFQYRQQRLREMFDAADSDSAAPASGRINPTGQDPEAAAVC